MWNNIRQDNRNGLLGKDPTVDGLKTGHTDSAGFCLATSANRNGMRLISVVMGAPSVKAREEASAALLNYGYTFFETVRVKAARADDPQAARLQVGGGVCRPWACPPTSTRPWPRPGRERSRPRPISTNEPLIAPLAAGAAVGEFTVTDATGAVVARCPARAARGGAARRACGRAPSTASRCGSTDAPEQTPWPSRCPSVT